MTDGTDRTAGDPVDPVRPALPPHLDPRGPRRALPPRPTRAASQPGAAGDVLPPAAGTRAPAPRGRLARALALLAVLTSAAVLATSIGGYFLLQQYDGNINRLPGLALGKDRPADLPRDAQNILIVGSDSRGDLQTGQGAQGRGDTFVSGQRSDTVILAHLYGDSDTAQLVSFPRDSWVTIPSFTDPKTGQTVPAHESKINAAFFEGGPALLVKTVERLTGIVVDRYVQVDFDGFQTIVNRLDGVEVCLTAPAKEKDSGIDLQAGRQTIRGDQALAFVRQRKGLPNGDVDRIGRQQQFIGAIVRKVLSAGTLANPLRLNGVITAATQSLVVDDGTSFGDLQDLALRFKSFDSGGVIFSTAPITDLNGRRQRQSVVLLDEAALAVQFDQIRRDRAPDVPAPAPTTQPSQALTVRPGAVRVRVLNGAGVAGLGRKAFSDLEGVGFQLVGAPGNRGADVSRTTIHHGPGKADSARTLAAAVPGATVELDQALGATLELVVGADYAGAKQVSVAGQPAPRAPSPGASPKIKTAAEDPCAR